MSGEERVMIVQLGRVLFHDLLCLVHGVCSGEWSHIWICLLIRMLIVEEILDLAFACCSLIYCETRGEFSMCAYLDGIQHAYGEILAVIAYYVVGWLHVMDYHLA